MIGKNVFTPGTYYIKTYGCQANIADSNKIAGILESKGFERFVPPETKTEGEALEKALRQVDLFIINTCSVRQKSEDKAYGIGKLVKKIGASDEEDVENSDGKRPKKPFIILAGCVVGSATGERKRTELAQLKRKTPWVDAYVGPLEITQEFDLNAITSVIESPAQAFVNISQGCDNFCTYCVVPYARGPEVSRGEEEIVGEVKNLVGRGFKKTTLCGQNVNSWGLSPKGKFKIRAGSDQKLPFADLLRKIHKITGLEEIEFISSNPFDFTQDLIDTVALPKISNYLHIAVQSGNNDVLKRMNRRHTVKDFLNLVEKIKKVKSKVELGTDIIVGFPGETREQFMDTVALFEKVVFKVAYISMYSVRQGTAAAKLYEDDVPLTEKKWRHAYLTGKWKESLKKRG